MLSQTPLELSLAAEAVVERLVPDRSGARSRRGSTGSGR